MLQKVNQNQRKLAKKSMQTTAHGIRTALRLSSGAPQGGRTPAHPRPAESSATGRSGQRSLGNSLQADRVLPAEGQLNCTSICSVKRCGEVDGPGVVCQLTPMRHPCAQLHGLCKGALGTDGIVHHISTALCGELRQLSAVSAPSCAASCMGRAWWPLMRTCAP